MKECILEANLEGQQGLYSASTVRHCLDNGGVSGALLTDLSKTFDSILHDLLIAKLAAYGFNYTSLQMLQSYLSNRKQRTKTNDAYSKYCEILF